MPDKEPKPYTKPESYTSDEIAIMIGAVILYAPHWQKGSKTFSVEVHMAVQTARTILEEARQQNLKGAAARADELSGIPVEDTDEPELLDSTSQGG